MTVEERVRKFCGGSTGWVECPQTELVALITAILDEERAASRARWFLTYPWWEHTAIERMIPADVVEMLLDFARQDHHEDFLFLAGSAGVPLENRDAFWEGTRRRLGRG